MTEAPAIEKLGAATLNRDWRLEVDTSADPEAPVWVVVRGRTDFKPTLDTTLQDDSDMDSEGYKSQTATALAWSLETKLVRKATAAGGYDEGQETLRLAAQEMGPDNTVHVRWFKLGAVRTEAYEGYAAAAWAPDGGAMDGLDTATVTLTGQGRRIAITHPYTPTL